METQTEIVIGAFYKESNSHSNVVTHGNLNELASPQITVINQEETFDSPLKIEMV